MSIIVLILLILAMLLFIMASSDGDSKKGYIGLALWVLSKIVRIYV